MSGELELTATPGFVEPRLREEFPGLGLRFVVLPGRMRRSPRSVRQRLAALGSRYRGGSVIAMRTQPIPHAYRAFYRQVGLDPDAARVPSEEAAVSRLLHGGFRSRDLINDALLIAVVETGVAVWAVDGDRVAPGGLGIRTSVAGEALGTGETAVPLAPGRMVVADAGGVHALLFGDVARAHAVGPQTVSVSLFAVGVPGVPEIHLEEALWICVDVLRAA